jgi:hypothetical protein
MFFFFGGKSKPLIVAPVTSLADAAQRRQANYKDGGDYS